MFSYTALTSRSSLAGAIAAISLLPATALADFRPLDDAAMAAVTGQAGVSIELETKLSIDRLTWTDEGALSVNGLRMAAPTCSQTSIFRAISALRIW